MIDFFQFRRHPSHYEQEAKGPTITVTKPILTTNEKIVEACKNLDDYAREYTPALNLTETQKERLEDMKLDSEMNRRLFDLGLWLARPHRSSFKVREG